LAQKIAHVDDDPDIRQAVRTILEVEGYAIENYAVMADFITALDNKQNIPSLAILDVMVEKEDSGLGAYDILRTKCPQLPVILLTSLGEMIRPYFEQENLKVWIVEKPVIPEKLLSIVHSHVDKPTS
jgi:two-component system, OmpR family, response regulator ChvI